jgi:hypothetical protein
MYHFLKNSILLYLLFSSVNIFSQDNFYGKKVEKPFTPKFSIGSGLYVLKGDIQSDNSGIFKGMAGFNAGMKFDFYKNIDFSFMFFKNSFSGDNSLENFSSEIDAFGAQLDYSSDKFSKSIFSPLVSMGIYRLGISPSLNGNKLDRVSVFSLPFSFGLRMDVTKRLQFDLVMTYGIGLGDIDMSEDYPNNSDSYQSLNFTVHYDLFTKSKNNQSTIADNYYADVNFVEFESNDEDGDLVPDFDDFCPNTPKGIKVDEDGCPLDDDNDGIPNYLDQQKNTPKGAIVDKNGVILSVENYKNTYSDVEIASRKYAEFYNENEIKREDFKTIDEYLIAKANAFNKMYIESLNDNLEVKELVYKVKIWQGYDSISAPIMNRLLSIDDLESFRIDNDIVIYAVGDYSTYEQAIIRQGELEEKLRFSDTEIIVDNNGILINYVDFLKESNFQNEEKGLDADAIVVIEDDTLKNTSEIPDSLNNEANYRVQIGAFKNLLPDEVFANVKNVVPFVGNDGMVRYMVGVFSNYNDAVDYQAQMIARGFHDAFIVTYKDGKRIGLNYVLNKDNYQKSNYTNSQKSNNANKKDENSKNNINDEVLYDLNDDPNSSIVASKCLFTVQILVSNYPLSKEDFEKMNQLGNIDKKTKGSELTEFYAGTYETMIEAKTQLDQAKDLGFIDSFIFVTVDGERVSLDNSDCN